MAYATVDEVLQRMGHSGATSADLVAKITDALDAATIAIDSDCGRVFTASTATRTFAACDSWELRLPDLTAITTLKFDDNDDGVFETTIAASGYELDKLTDRTDWPYDRVRLLDRSFPAPGRRRRRVQIVGTWGWAAVPAPINQACSLLAARVAQRSSQALFGVQSFGDLGASVIRSNDPDYRNLIGPYVVPMVA